MAQVRGGRDDACLPFRDSLPAARIPIRSNQRIYGPLSAEIALSGRVRAAVLRCCGAAVLRCCVAAWPAVCMGMRMCVAWDVRAWCMCEEASVCG